MTPPTNPEALRAMTWKCDERALDRNFPSTGERKNFAAGYSDGFHCYPMWSGSERDYFPTAYKDGFSQGRDDGLEG